MRVHFVICCTSSAMFWKLLKNYISRLSANFACVFISRFLAILSNETSVLHCITSGALLWEPLSALYIKLSLLFSLTNQKLHVWFSNYYKWIIIMKCSLWLPHSCHEGSNSNFFKVAQRSIILKYDNCASRSFSHRPDFFFHNQTN